MFSMGLNSRDNNTQVVKNKDGQLLSDVYADFQ